MKLTGLSGTKLAARLRSSGLSVICFSPRLSLIVIPGLVPGIQPSAGSGASGSMDPGDEHRDDNVLRISAHRQQVPAIDRDDAAGHEGSRI